jgi:hypothetical protein
MTTTSDAVSLAAPVATRYDIQKWVSSLDVNVEFLALRHARVERRARGCGRERTPKDPHSGNSPDNAPQTGGEQATVAPANSRLGAVVRKTERGTHHPVLQTSILA